jgi:predicted molibdopterin-dependent oxidoreductase YjgC
MEFKEYDFTRNPVVQNEDFFLESKCASCGLSILACSIDELVEQEAAHRTQCRRRLNSAA